MLGECSTSCQRKAVLIERTMLPAIDEEATMRYDKRSDPSTSRGKKRDVQGRQNVDESKMHRLLRKIMASLIHYLKPKTDARRLIRPRTYRHLLTWHKKHRRRHSHLCCPHKGKVTCCPLRPSTRLYSQTLRRFLNSTCLMDLTGRAEETYPLEIGKSRHKARRSIQISWNFLALDYKRPMSHTTCTIRIRTHDPIIRKSFRLVQ